MVIEIDDDAASLGISKLDESCMKMLNAARLESPALFYLLGVQPWQSTMEI
jgi:hypothetical protein